MGNNLNDLLKLFYDKVSPEDMMFAKIVAHVTTQITRQRMARKMNQKEFADFLGCSQAYISKLENGECNFTLGKLCELAIKLDMDVSVEFKPNTERFSRKIIAHARTLEKKENSWTSFADARPSRIYKKTTTIRKKEKYNYV